MGRETGQGNVLGRSVAITIKLLFETRLRLTFWTKKCFLLSCSNNPQIFGLPPNSNPNTQLRLLSLEFTAPSKCIFWWTKNHY